MTPTNVDALTECIVALIREEVPRIVQSGRNWKLIINGSQAGDVRAVFEEHADVARQFRSVRK